MYSSCEGDIGFDVAGSFYDILRAIDKNVIELRQKREKGGGFREYIVCKAHFTCGGCASLVYILNST